MSLGKKILSLLDNKGLYGECAYLQSQLTAVIKMLDKLQKDNCTHRDLIRCLRK